MCPIPSGVTFVTRWQNRGLTWTCPRPRTWAAAIRSFFWLAYRKGGRDGKHENTGDGRRRKEGIEQQEPHPGFSRTPMRLKSHRAFRRNLWWVHTRAPWAKQACPHKKRAQIPCPTTNTHPEGCTNIFTWNNCTLPKHFSTLSLIVNTYLHFKKIS